MCISVKCIFLSCVYQLNAYSSCQLCISSKFHLDDLKTVGEVWDITFNQQTNHPPDRSTVCWLISLGFWYAMKQMPNQRQGLKTGTLTPYEWSNFIHGGSFSTAPSTYLSLPMVKDIVGLLLGVVNDCLVLDNDDIKPLDLHFTETWEVLNGVHHVSNPLEALTECVKLSKDVVLTEEQKYKWL